MNKQHLNYLNQLLGDQVKQNQLYGCAVLVGDLDGDTYTACFGDIQEDTLCMLCSMTKPVTAVAAWILIERGVIDPMEPVSQYLPGYANPKVLQDGVLEDAHREILIRDLLNMTSGISYGLGVDPEPGSIAAQIQAIEMEYKKRVIAGEKLTNADLMDAIGKVPLIFHPGEQWDYGKSADVLGAVVEVASGMSLGSFFQKEIFEPLDMKDTGFVFTKEQAQKVAAIAKPLADGTLTAITGPEFYGDDPPLYEKPYFENAGGGISPVMGRGLYSTLDDYAKFCRMLLQGGTANGHRILSKRTIEQFELNHLTKEQSKTVWPVLDGYGYGNLMRVMQDRALNHSNGSVGEFGWDGALGTYMMIDRAAGIYAVYMQQNAAGASFPVRRKMRSVIYSAL